MTTPRTAICSGNQGGSFAGDVMVEVLADEVGTNGYSRIEEGNRYGIENSQLYVKFQYLFDW